MQKFTYSCFFQFFKYIESMYGKCLLRCCLNRAKEKIVYNSVIEGFKTINRKDEVKMLSLFLQSYSVDFRVFEQIISK